MICEETLKLITQVENEMQEEKTPIFWPFHVDFILANLFDKSILLCANGEEKLTQIDTRSKGLVGPTSNYFKENENRMRFILWFRPLLLLGLTICFYICMMAAL